MHGLHPAIVFLISEPRVFLTQTKKKKIITATLGLSQAPASMFLLICIERLQQLQLISRGGTEIFHILNPKASHKLQVRH